MKYYLLFIFFFCASYLEAQNQDSLWNSWLRPTKILKGADGTTYWCIDGDTVAYYKPISRKELRSSRDMFFYQRGDTVYFLYDPTDSLQYITSEKGTVGWYSRPRTQDEIDSDDILDVEVDRNLLLMFNIDPRVKPRIVTEEFVKQKRVVTREELLAFFHREKRRCQEAYKRTGNSTYVSYYFDNCTYRYFSVEFIFVPIGNGKYELYKVRP